MKTKDTRIILLQISIFILFLILAARIFYFQVIKGKYFTSLSEGNRIRIIEEEAARGRIYDRYGKILVDNTTLLSCSLLTSEKGISTATRKKLEKILDIKLPDLEKRSKTKYTPSVIELKDNIDIKTLSYLKEDFSLKEILILKKPKRIYPDLKITSHFLGYVGKMTKQKFELLSDKGYKISDKIGIEGIENFYDSVLRGENGGSQIEVDAKGKIIKTIGYQNPIPGADLYLTIDKNLQEVVEEALIGFVGAAIALDPNTGEILAICSSPSIDMDLFHGKIDTEVWNKIIQDENKPLQNRAISNKYPPASVFKIITTTAALEENVVDRNSKFFCRGYLYSGKRKFRCWKRSGHGVVDFNKAIAYSCDVFFYNIAKKLGSKKLYNWAKKFNIGKKTGIDLPGETSGTLPSQEYKMKKFKSKWYQGDTLNMSIGQGFLQTTPLQMAVATSVIANGGNLITPHIVKTIKDKNNTIYINSKIKKLPISNQTLNIIRQGMIDTVEFGTGTKAKISTMQIAGKTGTSQDPPRKKPHSWFVSFAPANNPKIVVLVFVEQGGDGGKTSAPIAKRIYEEGLIKSKYFKDFKD